MPVQIPLLDTDPNTDTTKVVRVVGNQSPAFLQGRSRASLIAAFAPKVAAPVVELDEFDLAEIIDQLHYGTDCAWAA